jgi:hypothetical protein
MKYIITEEQQNRLLEIILNYLNSNLVPKGGWKDKKYYQKEMEQNYEMFMFFDLEDEDEDYGWGEESHMWYSLCDNPNLDSPIREDYCPLITIDSTKYDSLDGYFGPRWQETFKRWFTKHTGLPVKHVESQNW